MRNGDIGDNLPRHELHALQRALRVRASNLKKRGKGQGLIRPLSKDDVESDPLGFVKPLTLLRNGQVIQKAPGYLFDPEGYFFSLWNLTAVILILSLVFYLPLLSAFFDEPAQCNYFHISEGPPHSSAGVAAHNLNWGWQLFPVITNYFFLVDILVHCFTAIKVGASAKEYGLFAIWGKYLRSWFLLDALACLPLQCILFAAAPRVNWYNVPNFIRLVRVAGIHRRAHGSPFRVFDSISNLRQEFSYSARRIAMAAFAECVAMHWFACILWWTIRLEGYPSNTWVSLQGLVHASVPEQYCWSIFVIVSAAVQNTWGDYNPVTWGEALVWLFAMITVAVLFAVMVGFIVAIIKSSVRAETRYKERMDTVMDAMTSREVSEDTKQRVMQFYKHMYKGGQNWFHDTILRELPYDMQVEAALHSAQGLLSKVSLIVEEPTLMERVALMLHPSYALKGEQVLKQGWPGRSMWFVRAGFVDLVMDGGVVDTIQPGDYFGEVALLSLPPTHEPSDSGGYESVSQAIGSHSTRFPSLFTARALTNCSLYVLRGEEFQQAVEDYPAVKAKLQAWAERHSKKLLEFASAQGHDPGDLFETSPSSYELPPDTPRELDVVEAPELNAVNSSSSRRRSSSIHISSPLASKQEIGFSNEQILEPKQQSSREGSSGLADMDQSLSDIRGSGQSIGRSHSRSGERPRRWDSGRRGLQGHDRRVVADSATILSFADVRSSIDVPDQHET